MYFHLIWIKEKNWEKYDLDVLLEWWDEDLIRKFLWIRGVVIVSINEFKEDPKAFWNITVSVDFSGTEINFLMQWEDLWERLYFLIFLWLAPIKANYIENPISEEEVKKLIDSNTLKIKEEEEKLKKEQKLAELEEQKKYEESWISEWLKIINNNIDRIEQLMKAWEWIISGGDMKELDTYLNEMKKIRLWTNFNKMAMMVLESHNLVKRIEKEILDSNEDKKFLIDKNSCVTNIDVLSEYFQSNRIAEKSKLHPAALRTSESMSNMMWENAIFLSLLRYDLNNTFDNVTVEEVLVILLDLLEYIVLCSIIVVSLMWFFSLLLWVGNFSPYLLPAMWLLWLLLYLLNGLKLKWIMLNLVWFFVLVIIYRQWLKLLLNTFAL